MQWILPNNQETNNKNITIENIADEDDKNLYECKYNDSLDEDFTSFMLNVQYSPRIPNGEDLEPTQCYWTLNSTDQCILRFNTNPIAEIFSIMKGTENVTAEFFITGEFKLEERKELVYVNKKQKVEQTDSGNYTLSVKSKYFVDSLPLNINFTINIVDPQASEANLSLAVIICCSIL